MRETCGEMIILALIVSVCLGIIYFCTSWERAEIQNEKVRVHYPDEKVICYTFKDKMDCRATFELALHPEDLQ